MLNTCAQKFTESLKAKNLNFKSGVDRDGDSVVEFPYQGKITKIFFCGEDGAYMSLYLVFERIPDAKLADLLVVCNELNSSYKWFKFYLDKDNDLVIQDDAILDPDSAADEAFELLVRACKISEDVKPTIMRAIYV